MNYAQYEKTRYRIRLTKKAQRIPEGYWWLDDEKQVCFAEFNPKFKKKKMRP